MNAKVYIAGPMTGIPQFNFPAFDQVAGLLRMNGFEVVSPAELDDPDDRAAALASPDGHMHGGHHMNKTWGDFLARDVKLIADGGVEAVVVLTDWAKSRGARLETYVANALCGIPIVSVRFVEGSQIVSLDTVPRLDLFRAWTAEPTLAIHTGFAAVTL